MEYEKAKQLLVKDLHALSNTKACLIYGENAYTPAELAKEIEDETEVGKEHIKMFIEAMNFCATLSVKQPPKKWWQFWK